MKNFIEYVNINNFKSIRNLQLKDCRRINLLIGYPNVGKSNLLEAMSLFSVPFLNTGENLNRFIRIENKNELFYNASVKSCIIETNIHKAEFDKTLSLKLVRKIYNDEILYSFSNNLNCEETDDNYEELIQITNVLRYIFKSENQWKSIGDELLLPPFGENIIDTLSYNGNLSEVKLWIKKEFAKFGLEIILDKVSNCLKVQHRLNNYEIFQLPYSSIADTLQRVIFYKTAIASNSNSVLLFEELEAHAFPPYIRTVTQDIINSETNQFFITTHSPVVVNDFIEYEDIRKNTAIFLFDFKDGQTTVKRLSDEETDEVYNYGEDLFFNIEKFL
jgi:AAA15 family ATPase/GTPase